MANKRLRKIVKVILICLLILFVLAIVAYFAIAAMVAKAFFGGGDWSIEQEPWVEVGFSLPDEKGQFYLLRQHAHPFLAEYNRKIRLEMVGEEPVTITLPMNVGERTLINVYQYSGKQHDSDTISYIRLTNHWGNYDIDLLNGFLIEEESINNNDLIYLGRFDGQTSELLYIPASDAPEETFE